MIGLIVCLQWQLVKMLIMRPKNCVALMIISLLIASLLPKLCLWLRAKDNFSCLFFQMSNNKIILPLPRAK